MRARRPDRGSTPIAALALGLLVMAAPLGAQNANPVFAEFSTADGSRFLLVPTGGPPVIHWVMATPAGPLEDPLGMEGLSHATAHAAMGGTLAFGSKNAPLELQALNDLDVIQQEIDGLHVIGHSPSESLVTSLIKAHRTAQELADPLAWEWTLRRAPALESRLSFHRAGTLLHITTSFAGLGKVAGLLIERRENALLRDVHNSFRHERSELLRNGALGHILVGLALRGQAVKQLPGRAHAPLPRKKSLAVFQATHHPSRTLHVLTGGFDTRLVRKVVEETFQETVLPEPLDSDLSIASQAKRRLSIKDGDGHTLALAYRCSSKFAAEADLFMTWLAGPDGALQKELARTGRKSCMVRGEAVFFGPDRPGALLLIVTDPTTVVRDTPSNPFIQGVETSLATLKQTGLPQNILDKLLKQTHIKIAAVRTTARDLAQHLAQRVAFDGSAADLVLTGERVVSADSLRSMMETVLTEENRTLLVLERPN